jgi:hypothetical protein
MAKSTKDIFGKKQNENAPEDKSELAAMKEELAALKALLRRKEAAKGKAIRVSQKGAVSVYGFGRFPVTLYASQWKGIFALREDIEGFIEEHAAELPEKSAA